MEKDKKAVVEFRFLNLSIEFLGIIISLFLILWGIVISVIVGSNSFTSYIPSIVGTPILICCFLSYKYPKLQKTLMHIVVLVSILLIVGGLDFFRDIFTSENQINIAASLSKLIMFFLGIIYTLLCISSFRFHRKNKNQK